MTGKIFGSAAIAMVAATARAFAHVRPNIPMGGMSMDNMLGKTALRAAFALAVLLPLASTHAATPGYRFEPAGVHAEGGGKSIVAVRLVHDGKPVSGAIVIGSRADMGPINMAAMTAPIKFLGEQPAGIYRFEVTNGPVWKKPDNWAVSFDAKVQGVAQTVHGGVTVKLRP